MKNPYAFTPMVVVPGYTGRLDRRRFFTKTNTVHIPKSEVKPFEQEILLGGQLTAFKLEYVDHLGKSHQELMYVQFSDWQKMYEEWHREKEFKYHYLTLGLGATGLHYTQSDVSPYRAWLSTAKATYRYAFSKKWDMAFNSFFNTHTFWKNREDVSAQFLGINARFGYTIHWPGSPWGLGLMAGYYYVTMFVPGNKLGMAHMTGPQFFPVLSRRFPGGSNVYFYGKYSPVSTDFKIRPLRSREVACGAGYGIPVFSNANLLFMVDLSNLQFSTQSDLGVSNTASFSLGIGF